MKLTFETVELTPKYVFRTARTTSASSDSVIVRLEVGGLVGIGEAAPSRFYGETAETVTSFLEQIRPRIEHCAHEVEVMAEPFVLAARVVSTDPVSATALVRIAVQPLIKADAVAVQCELPRGAAIVPGAGGWTRDRQGRHVLDIRVALPPSGGKLIIKAELRGDRIRTGVTAGLALPRPGRTKAPAPPKTAPRIITTSKGERLRLHK